MAIVDDLVCLHSSDPATVYLSVAARMAHPSIEATHAALYEDRTLVRHHAMRRTLWVFTPEVARLAHAAATTRVLGAERKRLIGLLEDRGGVADGEDWLAHARKQITRVLGERGVASTRELAADLPDLAIPLELAPGKSYNATQSALSRVLLVLGFEGEVTRCEPTGTWINSQYQWRLMSDRLPGGVSGLDPVEAAGELAKRWLWTFGPAPASDLKWWAGWTVELTRQALELADAVEVRLEDGSSGWAGAGDVEPPDGDARHEAGPSVALLPGLDPTTMGWKERRWYLDPAHEKQLFDANGNAGPTIWIDGRVVGGWVQRPDGAIRCELLDRVGAAARKSVDAAADGLREMLGESRFKVRFPSRIQRDLLA